MAFFLNLIAGLALQIIGYALMPQPPGPKPPSASDLNEPTAEAGRPIPKVFGSMRIKSPNALWTGDKKVKTRTAGGK